MNEKKDDSEGRSNNLSDTAELLESLFKDTKDSRIKLVRRKARPKSGMKKRVVSKQRKGIFKKTSKTRVLMQGRPSEPEKRTGATEEKNRFREASLPGSMISKGSKIKPSSVQRSTADTKPTSTIRKDDSEKISKTDVLKKERDPSMTSAGANEDKAAIQERAEIVFDRVDQKGDASADHEGLAEADEEITEVLDKSALSSMISSLEARGEEAQQIQSAEERPISRGEEGEAEIFFDGVDQKRGVSADHDGVAEVDEEITGVLDKSSIVTNEGEFLHEQAAEEGAVTEGERDGVDRTLKEERPSDSAIIVGAAKEEHLFHDEPAASSSTAIEDSLLQAGEHEGYSESAFEPAPTLGPLDDSLAGTDEQDFHHRQAAEDKPILTDGRSDIQKASRLEKPREDEPADLEERIEQLVEEIQSLRSSVPRAMLVKVVLPLALFAILAVILSIWLMPFDFSKREEAQEMAREEVIKTPEPEKRDIAPETSKKIAAVAEQDVEFSDAAGIAEAVQKEEPVSRPFSIYLGSYESLKQAEKAMAKHKMENIFAYLSEVYLGGKVEFYRVFTGRFEGKAQAEEYMKKKGLKGAKVWKME